ncbi:MAG TPA: AMP-binding protein [Candidatus Deferrimicrobiaceae bacterium]
MDFLNVTTGRMVDEIARQYPENDALVYVDRGLRLTYRQFREQCRALCRGLMSMGVKKGDHVAIWATNYPEWVLLQFAAARMGAVLITVNTAYRPFELEYLLKQSDAGTLILIDGFKDANYPDTLYEVCPELKKAHPGALRSEKFPHLRNVVYIGQEKMPGMLNWDEMMAMGENIPMAALLELERSCDPGDVIAILYTSGTTGFPKGVMLTHRNLVMNGYCIGEGMKFTEKDRLCIPVPFFHCFGCVLGTMASVTHGATMVPVQHFNPQAVLESITKEKCTAVHGVPTMFIAELELLEKSAPGTYDLSSLRTGIMAGSLCPTEIMKAVMEKMNMTEITNVYGQTESSPGITQTHVDDTFQQRVSTVGRVFPGVEAKIVDPETRKELPVGTPGELATRGYHIMKGYYKNPEATDEVIDKDGWLYTGDLAVVDKDGFFTITGRAKDMIIRGGENIYPREVEEYLYTHPHVLDVQVVGVPSVKYGEEVCACVRLRDGVKATEQELVDFCKGKIANFKVPKYVAFVDDFPKTASGKIQKYKLREEMTRKFGLEGIAQ